MASRPQLWWHHEAMAPFTLETAIARPADQVFAYLRDYSNQREWQGANVLEVVVEPPGPAR
jgi:Polyketide cyclase / dehydrase and lipid transport